MGREVASAFGRWFALEDFPVRAELTAVCDLQPGLLEWFRRVPTVRLLTTDHRELLASPEVDVVYVAVPHHRHEAIYLDVLRAGRDLLAEKPFGIDLEAARRIRAEAQRLGRFVRVSSEFPFLPGAQRALQLVAAGGLGRLLEARCAFLHSSDLDPRKPVNWKRQTEFCGEAGVMADLGMHVAHGPLRLGWRPDAVFARLQKIYATRPNGHGGTAVCDTWDNATLHCRVPVGDQVLPLTPRDETHGTHRDQYLGVRGAGHRPRRALFDQGAEDTLDLPARGRADLDQDRPRVCHAVQDDHRRHLRARVPGRHHADVGGVSGRTRRAPGRKIRLRHTRRGGGQPRTLGGGAGVAPPSRGGVSGVMKSAGSDLHRVRGAASWRLASDRVEAFLTRDGGQLAPVTFRTARGPVQPYAIAPWSEERLGPGTPAVLRALRGDFFCLPFGGNERPWRGERHPVHGETASARWRLVSVSPPGPVVELTAELVATVRPGRVRKRVRLRAGETNVYCRDELRGFQGPMCLGHHAMLAFPAAEGAGRIALSPWRGGQVCPRPFESPVQGGYSALKTGARFRDLRRLPLAGGGWADLTRYPAREGFEDLVLVSARRGARLAWTAVKSQPKKYCPKLKL